MSVSESNNKDKLRRQQYLIGFGLSLILTLASYIVVARHVDSEHTIYSDRSLTIALSVFAITQLFVQLVFFLHIGSEKKPRWNLITLLFAIMVVGIIVAGSIWIMQNLNYHMGSPSETNHHIIRDEGY